MRIAIDAPVVRSLSANEKMVYQFLSQGLTIQDIAHRMKISVSKNRFFDYRYDVPVETVMGLITSIREKGWDIPMDTHNKERNEMARITEEQKREIVQLAMTKAMTHKEIAEKFSIGKSTVWWLVDQYKKSGEPALSGETEITEKEPATVAAATSSKQEDLNDIPADIIPPSEENVKHQTIPDAVEEACLDKIDYLKKEIAAEQAVIDDWKAQIAEINEFLKSFDYEVQQVSM